VNVHVNKKEENLLVLNINCEAVLSTVPYLVLMVTVYSVPGVKFCRFAVCVPLGTVPGIITAPPAFCGLILATYSLKFPVLTASQVRIPVVVVTL
jgi:hypothetical protein